jgi:hypothetical protein
MPSHKTWRTRVTLLDWHLAKNLLGCTVFLISECLYVHWIEYALFPEMVCCNVTKIIF